MNRIRYALFLALQAPWVLAMPVAQASGEDTLSGITQPAPDSGLPALLEYAQQHPQSLDVVPTPSSAVPVNKTPATETFAAQKRLMKTVKAQQKLLGQQVTEITQLKAQLTQSPDVIAASTEQAAQLQALQRNATVTQQQLTESTQQIAALKTQQVTAEKTQLMVKALQLKNDTLAAQLRTQQQASQVIADQKTAQLVTMKKQWVNDQQQFQVKQQTNDKLAAELTTLTLQQQKSDSSHIEQLTTLKKQANDGGQQLRTKSQQLEKLTIELASVKAQQNKVTADNGTTTAAQVTKITQLENRLSVALQRQQDGQAIQNQQTTQLEALKKQLAEGLQQLQAKKQVNEKVTTELTALKAQVDKDSAMAVTQVTALQASLSSANQAIKQAQDNLVAQQTDAKKHQDALSTQLQEVVKQNATLAQSNQALTQQRDGEQRQLKDTATQLSALTAQLATAKLKPNLKTAAAQQAYTAGVSMGSDALGLLRMRDAQGVTLDHNIVLSGIRDTFSGAIALDEKARNKALFDTMTALNQHMTAMKTQSLADGKRYLTEFLHRKGVVQENGIYSLVEYAGVGAINPDDVVDVVMKESLPDGTVTVDMESSGRIMSQPLKAYPPVFRQALSRLGNHGAMTLVVPPEKAYGDKGVPPRIPPDATMTYSVRIMDVTPPGTDSKAQAAPTEPVAKKAK